MFLAFLTKSRHDDDVLVVCYNNTVGAFYSMQFSTENPSPIISDNEVRCGIATPATGGSWTFKTLGGGTLQTQDDEAALDYFIEIKTNIDGEIDADRLDAHQHFDAYIKMNIENFFDPDAVAAIAATYMPVDIAEAMIESTGQLMN